MFEDLTHKMKGQPVNPPKKVSWVLGIHGLPCLNAAFSDKLLACGLGGVGEPAPTGLRAAKQANKWRKKHHKPFIAGMTLE